jgi:uncharacterized protein (DUF486 family)
MTVAWYGHLKLRTIPRFENLSLLSIILLSWFIALFEYSLQVPANRISILVFTAFTLIVFKDEHFRTNHLIGFVFLILAVYFVFKK